MWEALTEFDQSQRRKDGGRNRITQAINAHLQRVQSSRTSGPIEDEGNSGTAPYL